jgi:hypothetical protein
MVDLRGFIETCFPALFFVFYLPCFLVPFLKMTLTSARTDFSLLFNALSISIQPKCQI